MAAQTRCERNLTRSGPHVLNHFHSSVLCQCTVCRREDAGTERIPILPDECLFTVLPDHRRKRLAVRRMVRHGDTGGFPAELDQSQSSDYARSPDLECHAAIRHRPIHCGGDGDGRTGAALHLRAFVLRFGRKSTFLAGDSHTTQSQPGECVGVRATALLALHISQGFARLSKLNGDG